MNARQIAQKAVKEWFAYQNALELEMALKAVKAINPRVIMELGTAHGASLAAWCEIASPELAIALDPEDIPRTPEQKASFDKLADKYKFQRIARYNRDPLAQEELEKILNKRTIDFLFIDGAHGFDDVRFDFYTYLKYMSQDGVIGFHDIFYCDTLADSGSQVSWLWDRLKRQYDYNEFYYHSTMGIGLIYLGKVPK